MQTIIENLVRPLAHRAASWVGLTLTTLGMSQPDAQLLVAAVPVVIGFVVDLAIRRIF